jgi:2-polyprenyl-6-methoxyphenol hydroxylase-like FAD-dependent oxidoreductase
VYWWFEQGDHFRFASELKGLFISRPLLEGIVRERVRRIPNVQFWEGCQVEGLMSSSDQSRITGIKIHNDTAARPMEADLVIDATGRGSNTPIWLDALGYSGLKEERIEVNMAYATRHFLRSPEHLNGACAASIPSTPSNRRGGVIVAQEGNRWVVTLTGRSGEKVPNELQGFIEFARKLSQPYVYNVISRAQAIDEPQMARFPASVRRRYEHMNRFPEGFLVLGDAICSFNPVYGQGMTVAVLEALQLDKVLREGTRKLAEKFFMSAAKVVDAPWSMAAGNDLRMPDVPGKRTLGGRILDWYLAKVNTVATYDSSVAVAFQNVQNLLAPPQSLFKPALVARVFSNSHSVRPMTRTSEKSAQQAA